MFCPRTWAGEARDLTANTTSNGRPALPAAAVKRRSLAIFLTNLTIHLITLPKIQTPIGYRGFQGGEKAVKQGDRQKGGDTIERRYLMQGGETVLVAEVWAHIILQQVAYWWKERQRNT